jgi:Tfp pilus assembly protein PilN
MRALDLDLVRRRPAWPAWLLLAVGLLLAGESIVTYAGLRDELGQLQRRASAPTVAARSPKPPLNEQTQREFDAARLVLQELALPWDALFRSIESSIGTDTALLSIEPDASKRMVRISGEARNYLAILNFMQRLQQPQVLTGVHLLSHQMREDVAERPYQFTLAATWRMSP